MKRKWLWITLSILLVGGLVAWWWRPNRLDYRPATDAAVEEIVARSERQDGIEFLESGGKYVDKDPTQAGMDQSVVLPFLRKLHTTLGHRPVAMLMDGDSKIATVMTLELPSDEKQLKQLQEFFQAEDAKFPGVILHQYGNKWMHFDFLDATAAKAMNMENWEID